MMKQYHATDESHSPIAEFDTEKEAIEWAEKRIVKDWGVFGVHKSSERTLVVGYDGELFWPNSWITIDPNDAETFPPDYSFAIITAKGGEVADANYENGKFYYEDGKEIFGVCAWQLWPDPAPLPEVE